MHQHWTLSHSIHLTLLPVFCHVSCILPIEPISCCVFILSNFLTKVESRLLIYWHRLFMVWPRGTVVHSCLHHEMTVHEYKPHGCVFRSSLLYSGWSPFISVLKVFGSSIRIVWVVSINDFCCHSGKGRLNYPPTRKKIMRFQSVGLLLSKHKYTSRFF